jgi:hypothetical protein
MKATRRGFLTGIFAIASSGVLMPIKPSLSIPAKQIILPPTPTLELNPLPPGLYHGVIKNIEVISGRSILTEVLVHSVYHEENQAGVIERVVHLVNPPHDLFTQLKEAYFNGVRAPKIDHLDAVKSMHDVDGGKSYVATVETNYK